MLSLSRRLLILLPLFAVAGTARAEDQWKTVPTPAALPKADESGLAPVNDIQMYCEIYNAAGGDPVLLLHGGLGSTLNWGKQVPAAEGLTFSAAHHRSLAMTNIVLVGPRGAGQG